MNVNCIMGDCVRKNFMACQNHNLAKCSCKKQTPLPWLDIWVSLTIMRESTRAFFGKHVAGCGKICR